MNSFEAGTYINKALHELSQVQATMERGDVPPEVTGPPLSPPPH
jgi:hypothetical protein